MEAKLKECKDKDCKNHFKQFKSTDQYCSLECAVKNKKTSQKRNFATIKPLSDKRRKEVATYHKERLDFLNQTENKKCFVDGCNRSATTIEHRKGRVGFADDYARQNNIPLLNDKRFWAGCCNEHNLEFERNPELSQEYQLSKIHDGKKELKRY